MNKSLILFATLFLATCGTAPDGASSSESAKQARGDSTSGQPAGTAAAPDLGANASLRGKRIFPSDNPWNQDISAVPVDPNSANLIASLGLNTTLHPDFGTTWEGAPNGIPYIVVSGTQRRVPITFA